MPRVGKGRKSKAATEQRGPVAAAPTGTKQEPDPFRVLCRHWPSADGRKTTTEQMGNRGFRRFRKASSPRNLAGKPLAEFFTTPIRRITVFYGMIMCLIRFTYPYFIDSENDGSRRIGVPARFLGLPSYLL